MLQGGNMKGHYIIKLLVVIIGLGLATALASAGDDEDVVKTLISKRTDAMNGFFASELNYKEAEALLVEAEAGRLLEEDLQHLKDYFRTDIEYIESYQISQVEFTEAEENLLCANVTIDWELEGMQGEERYRCDYSVICEKYGDTFRLVQFF